MRYLISFAILLTTASSCNHQHMKEKYGHFSQFGPRFNDYVHNEHHHTHFHGHVAIINTHDPASALDKLASITKKLPSPTPTASLSVNKQLFGPDRFISPFRVVGKEKLQYRTDGAALQIQQRKDKYENEVARPFVDVPFSVKVIKGYFSG